MKPIMFLLMLVILSPAVFASECDWDNLGSCMADKFFDQFYDFLLDLVNVPINFLVPKIHSLLTVEPPITIFKSMWRSIVFSLSLLYALFLSIVAIRFMVSGSSPVARERAKQELQHALFMMFGVSASFVLYTFGADIGHAYTQMMLSYIDPSFFMFTLDSALSFSLQMLFGWSYLITLVITLIVLSIRYVLAGVGVVLFPLGIFLLYLRPCSSYGRWILNLIGANLFVGIPSVVVLAAFSKLLGAPVFAELKVFVMISAFVSMNLFIVWVWYASVLKSAMSWTQKVTGSIAKVVKYL